MRRTRPPAGNSHVAGTNMPPRTSPAKIQADASKRKLSRCSWIARKCPFFYGYVIIALCVCGQVEFLSPSALTLPTRHQPRFCPLGLSVAMSVLVACCCECHARTGRRGCVRVNVCRTADLGAALTPPVALMSMCLMETVTCPAIGWIAGILTH